MKKLKLITSFSLLMFLVIASPVFAEESTPSPKTVRSQIREVRQEAKVTISQLRQEKKAALTEIKQKKIQTTFDVIKNSLSKRHDILITIKNKLSARIDKNPMKKDTSSAKIEFSKFDSAEVQYQTDFLALNNKFDELKTSDKPADLIKNLKDSVSLVKTDLENIRKILIKTTTVLAQSPKLTVTSTK
jgi:hypothetical protein